MLPGLLPAATALERPQRTGACWETATARPTLRAACVTSAGQVTSTSVLTTSWAASVSTWSGLGWVVHALNSGCGIVLALGDDENV